MKPDKPPPIRRLTSMELTALPSGLVAAIDVHAVQMIDTYHPVSWLSRWLGFGALIVVRGQKIFWPQVKTNLSRDPAYLALLAHELTHVWQYQTGMTLWRYIRRERGQYRYKLLPDKAFTAYGYEQQAAMVEDWVRLKGGLLPRYAYDIDILALEAVIPFADHASHP